MTQLNTAPILLTSIPALANACWPVKKCLASLLIVLAGTAGAQITQPVTPTFTEAGNVECAAIKKTAYERHARRVALLNESGESDQIPVLEKRRDERIEQLCALAFQATADKQAATADKQAAAADKQAAEEIREGARLKESRAAADKQAAAAYREMGKLFEKLKKNPASQADLDRLLALYGKLAAQATESEKKDALPILARAMRKLGLKVPGD